MIVHYLPLSQRGTVLGESDQKAASLALITCWPASVSLPRLSGAMWMPRDMALASAQVILSRLGAQSRSRQTGLSMPSHADKVSLV